jgi:glycosyltransferase involved in cell wall biosynthesis
VVAPTYNNAQTVKQVLIDTSAYVSHIIVVNDGSTDHTADILSELQDTAFENQMHLEVIHLKKNSGKGFALRTGFARAVAMGFRYAITIDTDGQHFSDDIPLFADLIRKFPDNLIVGVRNMEQEGIPKKSSFGNRFSNFWFKLETGVALPDTQSGFRLYPVERLKNIRFFTSKYEFEIEVLVRAAWAKIRIKWIPVKVHYEPKESRISHFRPGRDFFRISLLNTVLVLIAFLWIKPRDLIRRLNWARFKRFFRREFSNRANTSLRIACSAGFGVFMGIVPIWGYQLIVGLTLAYIMKLNKTIVFIAANISIPPMIPIILYGSFLMGGWFIGEYASPVTIDTISFSYVKHHLFQYLVGSIALAVVAGLLVFLFTWVAVSFWRKKHFSPQPSLINTNGDI